MSVAYLIKTPVNVVDTLKNLFNLFFLNKGNLYVEADS
jgi:hypothetical protein